MKEAIYRAAMIVLFYGCIIAAYLVTWLLADLVR